MALATRVGLGHALQLLGVAGELPDGLTFDITLGSGRVIHVIMMQRDGRWYFTAWHWETRFYWFWGSVNVIVEDIRLGDVPAHHVPRMRAAGGDPWAAAGVPNRAPRPPIQNGIPQLLPMNPRAAAE
jgi:hypothetical protein